MRFDQLTIKSQEAIQEAQRDARARGNAELTPDHVLLALLRQTEGVVVPILQKLGVDPDALAKEVESELDRRPKVSGASADAALSRELNRVFDRAFEVAREFGDEYVSTEHLLLALSESDAGDASRRLAKAGAKKDALLKALKEVRGSSRITDPNPEDKYQALKRYTRDLTEPAPHSPRKVRAARARGSALPGDRPGARPPSETQPGPARRAGRREDRDRGGPRPPHSHGGRARGVEEQAGRGAGSRRDDRRREVSRGVRGPVEGRPEGDRRGGRHDRPLHRRAPHLGRRGVRRRRAG